jgi:hypothetical protein
VLVGGTALAVTSVGVATVPTAGAAPATKAVVTMCPAPAGNKALVRYVYLNILNRCPSDKIRDDYAALLDSHALSRAQFTDRVDMSDENVNNNNVVTLYHNVLGRDPSAAELKAGAVSIRSTHGDANLIATLASSPDLYAHLAGTATQKDTAYLNLLLSNVLDRTNPTSTLDSYYGRLLHSPSTRDDRYRVAMYMEHSPENATSWVLGVYGAALQSGPTSPAAFAYWMNWLQGPAGHWRTFRMYTLFLASSGAYARAQTNPNPPGAIQRLGEHFHR